MNKQKRTRSGVKIEKDTRTVSIPYAEGVAEVGRAAVAATVPRINYVDRHRRRQEWTAYQDTPEYAAHVAEFQQILNDRLGLPGMPDMSAQLDDILAPLAVDGARVYANGGMIGTAE